MSEITDNVLVLDLISSRVKNGGMGEPKRTVLISMSKFSSCLNGAPCCVSAMSHLTTGISNSSNNTDAPCPQRPNAPITMVFGALLASNFLNPEVSSSIKCSLLE